MSGEEINEITTAVVSKIQEKYFLVEKTHDLSANFGARDAFIELVILEVCRHFGVTKDLLSHYRDRTRLECGWSGCEIKGMIANICRSALIYEPVPFLILGRFLGVTNASMKWSHDRAKGIIQTNSAFKKEYETVYEIIRAACSLNKQL